MNAKGSPILGTLTVGHCGDLKYVNWPVVVGGEKLKLSLRLAESLVGGRCISIRGVIVVENSHINQVLVVSEPVKLDHIASSLT